MEPDGKKRPEREGIEQRRDRMEKGRIGRARIEKGSKGDRIRKRSGWEKESAKKEPSRSAGAAKTAPIPPPRAVR